MILPFLRMMALNEPDLVLEMAAMMVTPETRKNPAMYPLCTYRHYSACLSVALRPDFFHEISVLLVGPVGLEPTTKGL